MKGLDISGPEGKVYCLCRLSLKKVLTETNTRRNEYFGKRSDGHQKNQHYVSKAKSYYLKNITREMSKSKVETKQHTKQSLDGNNFLNFLV